MLVKELKQLLEKLDDETKLKIIAPNCPPHINQFTIVPVVEENE